MYNNQFFNKFFDLQLFVETYLGEGFSDEKQTHVPECSWKIENFLGY